MMPPNHKTTVWIFSWLLAFSATFIFAAERPSTFPTNNNPEPTAQITKIENRLSALTEKVNELEKKFVQTQKENQRLHELSESNNLADYVSLYVPILIAVCAVGLTLWQGYQTRIHNRLSVRPDLVQLRSVRPYQEGIGIYIENNGLGPGTIVKLTLYFDDTPTPINHRDDMHKFSVSSGLIKFKPNLGFPQSGYSVRSAENFKLIEIDPDTIRQQNIDNSGQLNQQNFDTALIDLGRLIARINFKLTFKSFYGQTWTHNKHLP